MICKNCLYRVKGTNARKRERYHNDPVYRQHELERKRKQRQQKKETP